MKRKPKWDYVAPIDQLCANLRVIEMELRNIREEIASKEVTNRAIFMLKDAQSIADALAKGDDPHEWDT